MEKSRQRPSVVPHGILYVVLALFVVLFAFGIAITVLSGQAFDQAKAVADVVLVYRSKWEPPLLGIPNYVDRGSAKSVLAAGCIAAIAGIAGVLLSIPSLNVRQNKSLFRMSLLWLMYPFCYRRPYILEAITSL
jgi:hypothetical protein